jgi:hypothetical protein
MATVQKAVYQSVWTVSPKGRLAFLVAAAGWYLETGKPLLVDDIALRIHVSLVRAGTSYNYSTAEAGTVAAIIARLLAAGQVDTAAEFLGLSQAKGAAAPALSAIEKLPPDTAWGVLASFTTSARRWIGRADSIADRIDALSRAARIFDRISQREMAAELRQEALQLVLSIDDAAARLNELVAMTQYEASIGRMSAAHTLLAMAIDAARDVPPTSDAPGLDRLVETAVELQEIDLVRSVLRAQAAAVDKISPLAERVGGQLRMARLQARAGMATEARDSLVEVFRLARQLSGSADLSKAGSLFLALTLAREGDGAGALQALDAAKGTVLFAASTAAQVAAEIAVDRWRAGDTEVVRRALTWAESALDITPQEAALEPALEVSFAYGLAGDKPAAMEGLRRATQIADGIDQPGDRAAALLRVAQFAAAVQTDHFDPEQLGLEGWKTPGS